jgi:hypothetical protein
LVALKSCVDIKHREEGSGELSPLAFRRIVGQMLPQAALGGV